MVQYGNHNYKIRGETAGIMWNDYVNFVSDQTRSL